MDSLAVTFADAKDPRAIPRVDGPQRGRPALSRSMDAYGTGSSQRRQAPCIGLAKNAS